MLLLRPLPLPEEGVFGLDRSMRGSWILRLLELLIITLNKSLEVQAQVMQRSKSRKNVGVLCPVPSSYFGLGKRRHLQSAPLGISNY